MSSWFSEKVAVPTRQLLDALPVREQRVDPEQCDLLAIAIDGLFRSEVGSQYASWPPESTTDGTVVYLITRLNENTLEAVFITYIDFDGCVFPSRAVLTSQDETTRVVGFIGQVDDKTGEPPRFARGTIINASFDTDGRRAATLLLGHHEVQPVWTKAFEVVQ